MCQYRSLHAVRGRGGRTLREQINWGETLGKTVRVLPTHDSWGRMRVQVNRLQSRGSEWVCVEQCQPRNVPLG